MTPEEKAQWLELEVREARALEAIEGHLGWISWAARVGVAIPALYALGFMVGLL